MNTAPAGVVFDDSMMVFTPSGSLKAMLTPKPLVAWESERRMASPLKVARIHPRTPASRAATEVGVCSPP